MLFVTKAGAQANCTVIFALHDNAHSYFVDEARQLHTALLRQDIALLDLNHWQADAQPPFISASGRQRHLLRQQYQIQDAANQAVVIDRNGQQISRHVGSVTLVSAILNCPNPYNHNNN